MNTLWGSFTHGEDGSLKIGEARSLYAGDRGSIYMDFPYYGIESIQRCWSKDSINYKYIRSSDSRPKFLHSSDAYFIFEIKKGAKIAEIAYGNY